ncbi:MAG: hypothetical protein M3R27_10725 [Bacteroidota bacterium]|nr:hypothetical protein [Bacteroidota bacterium]
MLEIPTEKFIKQVDLRSSIVTLRSDGIMHFDIKAVEEFTETDVKDILRTVKEIGHGSRFLNLVTFPAFVTISKEARALSASNEGNEYTIADAMVVTSTAIKLVMNFYISFDKPVRPTRAFNTQDKAVEWLKKHTEY